jgi:hypothetical protein
MNCQRFEDIVGDIARGQMMEADVRRAALSHSDDCLTCGQRLLDEQALTRGLKALSSQMMSLSPSRQVEARLREAMRASLVPPPAVAKVNPRRLYWLAAAAAVLLFVAGAIALNWQRQSTPRGNTEFANATDERPEPPRQPDNLRKDEGELTVNQTDKEREVKPRRVQPRSVAQARPARPDRPKPEVVSNHAREIATDFIPLGLVNTTTLQDGGQIVRVELPRSALVSFGLPVNMDRLNEKVKADVWLGVDGTARAIRFVQ